MTYYTTLLLQILLLFLSCYYTTCCSSIFAIPYNNNHHHHYDNNNAGSRSAAAFINVVRQHVHHNNKRAMALSYPSSSLLFVSTTSSQQHAASYSRSVMKDDIRHRSEQHHHSTSQLYYNNDNGDNGGSYSSSSSSPLKPQPLSLHPIELQQKLASFASNIQRLRRSLHNKRVLVTTEEKEEEEEEEELNNNKSAIIGACNSLYYFLKDETEELKLLLSSIDNKYQHQLDETTSISTTTLSSSIQTTLESALLQSIRGTSDVHDFILLRKLIYEAVEYATAYANVVSISAQAADVNYSSSTNNNRYRQQSQPQPVVIMYNGILSPRIFGEAITSISKIPKVSLSKVKSIWNLYVYDVIGGSNDEKKEGMEMMMEQRRILLSSPPSSYELNVMLSVLSERQKVVAALKLYRQVAVEESTASSCMKGDAYTASILFGMLADSIMTSSATANNNNNNRHGATIQGERGRSKEGYGDDDDKVEQQQSPCWQWNEAISLLDTFSSSSSTDTCLNNYAYAALLKVNELATASSKTMAAATSSSHNGIKCAMLVLDRMKQDGISPDVITCSTILSTFDKCNNWKAAVILLNAMKYHQASNNKSSRSSSDNNNNNNEQCWALPSPNTFTYSSVITTCAKCNQGDVALMLLNEMEEEGNSISCNDDNDTAVVVPNTWVYNAAMLACTESTKGFNMKKSKGVHLVTCFDILEKMEKKNCNNDDDATAAAAAAATPDTVSYNIALSGLGETSFATAFEEVAISTKSTTRLVKYDTIYDIVVDILDTMEERDVKRDAITYHNAILACKSNSEHALALLRRSLLDINAIQRSSSSSTTSDTAIAKKKDKQQLKGRASTDGILFVANAALSVAASFGDIHIIPEVISILSRSNTKINATSIKHIIRTLGTINECESILALLICLRGQSFANDILKERFSIDILSNISNDTLPMIEEDVYSAAITSSLRNDALAVADQILLSMKKNGLILNQRSLKEIIAEYCRMAMVSSKQEFKVARIAKRQNMDTSKYGIVEPIYITSRARAKAALAMLKAVNNPISPRLLSSIAKACCAAGLWNDARTILRRMHRAAIRELRAERGRGDINASSKSYVKGDFLNELSRLHRSLLKFCAKGGNIIPALNFANDIQFLATQIQQEYKSQKRREKKNLSIVPQEEEQRDSESEEFITLSSRLSLDIPTPENMPESDFSDAGALSNILDRPIGLTGQDWKLILIAASR